MLFTFILFLNIVIIRQPPLGGLVFIKIAHFPPPHLLIFSFVCQNNISEILSQFVDFLTHHKASQYSDRWDTDWYNTEHYYIEYYYRK